MSTPTDLTVSVVIPSYRRPDLLACCLDGLVAQVRQPEQVIVVRRRDDVATAAAIADAPSLPLTEAVVDATGSLAALHVGAALATGDVVVFTDDDAVGRPDWLSRLLEHYADPSVGGVGGRDIKHPPGRERPCSSSRVGRVSSWGRHRGYHHVGTGPTVDVDVLKGVNMSFRRSALALPAQLLGEGSQVHNEVAASLWAKSHGWRLRYDPAALVDHFNGPRFDSDRREKPDPDAVRNEAYNLVFTMLSFRPEIWRRRAVYGLLFGDRASPGLVRVALAVVRGEDGVPHRLLPSLRGQVRALVDIRRGCRVSMVPAGAGVDGESDDSNG